MCLSVRMEQMGVGDRTSDVDDVSNYFKTVISINFHFVPYTVKAKLSHYRPGQAQRFPGS